MYLGSWGLYDYITFTCNTHTPSTGDATDADAVPTYRIYKEDNATPIATGNMALLDASNTTGFYEAMVQIHPTAGFVKGFTYLIHIAATVGGIDGSMSHTFQIGSVADLEYIDGVVIATGTAQLGVNVVSEADIDFGALKKTSLNARTLPTADYFDPSADTVANVTLVDTTTTNSDLISAVDIAIATWDRILTGATHNIANSAGKRLREMFDAGIYEEETAQGGTANTITLAATASAHDLFYYMMTLTIVDGTGVGQMRTFKDYNGTTKVATACMDWVITPDNTSKYVISAHACVGVFDMQQGVYDLINAECDLALADYAGPTRIEATTDKNEIITEVTTLHSTTDGKINGLEDLTVADIKAGISDGTYDLEEMMRLMFATLCGKVSGGGTPTITNRNGPDTKDRVIATVDVDGNRTAVILDGT